MGWMGYLPPPCCRSLEAAQPSPAAGVFAGGAPAVESDDDGGGCRAGESLVGLQAMDGLVRMAVYACTKRELIQMWAASVRGSGGV